MVKYDKTPDWIDEILNDPKWEKEILKQIKEKNKEK